MDCTRDIAAHPDWTAAKIRQVRGRAKAVSVHGKPVAGARCQIHWRTRRRTVGKLAHERTVRKYGLEQGQYDQLKAHQGGVCAICAKAKGTTKRLAVDHDHATGLVRGLLCYRCNDLLGKIRDDPGFFTRGLQYLTNPPAATVGFVLRPKMVDRRTPPPEGPD